MLPLPARRNLDLSLSLQYPVPGKPTADKLWNWRQKYDKWNGAGWIRGACTHREITHPLPQAILQLTAGPKGSLAFHSLLSLPGNVVFSDIVVYSGSAKMSLHETECAVILVGENSSALCQQCSKTKSSCTREIKYPILCPVTSNASALSHAKISIPQHHSDQNKRKEVCRLQS